MPAMLFILACAGCRPGENTEPALKIFNPPVVIVNGLSDTILKGKFISNEIAAVYPLGMGKYQFGDTIYVPVEMPESSQNDFRYEGDVYRALDTFDVNGLELIPDYEQTVYLGWYFQDTIVYPYYPVYFVNPGREDKLLLGKDSYIFGIQEAKNKFNYNSWQPIEYRGPDFCGNGTWAVIIHPGEFYLVLMKKYDGEMRTSLRLRFRMGQNLYVTKAFDGFVNPEQFAMPDSSFPLEKMRESNGAAAEWLFYGAMPEYTQWKMDKE